MAAAVPAKTTPSHGEVMLIRLGVLAVVAMVCWFAVRWGQRGCGARGMESGWFTGFGCPAATIT